MGPDFAAPDFELGPTSQRSRRASLLDVHTFYVPPSGGYVGCIIANGSVVMTLYAGFLEFKRGYAPPNFEGSDWLGLELSVFRPHGSPADRRPISREQALEVESEMFLQRP